eukprot:4470296-Prymnesium_polylepis.1
MRWLSIEKRASLLETALADRDGRVAKVGGELLASAWLRKCVARPEGEQGAADSAEPSGACTAENVLCLLKALDVVTHSAAAQAALDVLLGSESLRPLVAAAAKDWGTPCAHQPEAAFCL